MCDLAAQEYVSEARGEFRTMVGLYHFERERSVSLRSRDERGTLVRPELRGSFRIRPTGEQVDERVHVQPRPIGQEKVHGVALQQSPRMGRLRSKCRIMWTLPRTSFFEQVATLQRALYRAQRYRYTVGKKFAMNDLSAATTTNTLFDDGVHDLTGKRPWRALWPRRQRFDPSETTGRVFRAPLHDRAMRVPEMPCDLSHRPSFLLHQTNRLSPHLRELWVHAVCHIRHILQGGSKLLKHCESLTLHPISYTLRTPADAGFQLKYESFTQKRSIRRREAREESRCSKIGCRFHQDVGACVADRTRIRRLHLFSPQWKKF